MEKTNSIKWKNIQYLKQFLAQNNVNFVDNEKDQSTKDSACLGIAGDPF